MRIYRIRGWDALATWNTSPRGVFRVDMDTQSLLEFREAKDAFFATDHRSPIRDTDRAAFEGLTYFPPDDALRFVVTPEGTDPTPVTIATTTGEERIYQRVATVEIAVDGRPRTLALYDSGHPGWFLPFRDATSGSETYGAGRYLDLEPNDDGSVTIDFNYAYQPFCAYNDAYSCALPPLETWLEVPIRAGERMNA